MIRLTFVTLALLAAGSAHATCIYPRAPERVPDGKTATEEEMITAHKVVKQFNDDITAYTACLELEISALTQSGTYEEERLNELREMQIKKNNAAVDEAEVVAFQFNEQLKIYKAREEQD